MKIWEEKDEDKSPPKQKSKIITILKRTAIMAIPVGILLIYLRYKNDSRKR